MILAALSRSDIATTVAIVRYDRGNKGSDTMRKVWMMGIAALFATAAIAGTASPFFVQAQGGGIRAVQGFGTAPDAPTTTPYTIIGMVTNVSTLADDATPRWFTVKTAAGKNVTQNMDLDGAGMSPPDQKRFGRWLLAHLGKKVQVSGFRVGNAQICVPDRVAVMPS